MTISFLAANQIKQALKSKCTGCGPSYRIVVDYPLAQFNFRPTGKVGIITLIKKLSPRK